MAWIEITETFDYDELLMKSKVIPQIIFKHSTRCSISSMAKSRIEKLMQELSTKADLYLLDLLKYREISNMISVKSGVYHESPQIIVFVQQDVILDQSHYNVNANEILSTISST